MRFVFTKLFYFLVAAEAELDGATPDAVITDILKTAEVPR
jgi:hypothetical protein